MYRQIPSTRSVQGTNFANGNINFPFQLASGSWSPADSYFRMRVELTQQDGTTPVTCANDVAPNMDMFANMFTNIKYLINGVCVEEVCDYVPQICALKTRLDSTKSEMDGYKGSLAWLQHDQRERLRKVASDGSPTSDRVCDGIGLTRVQMGFDPLTSVALAANGLVTFTQNAGAIIPNPLPYKEGDYYVDTNAADQPLRLVTKILTNTGAAATMQTYPNLTTANGDAVRIFLRLPGSYEPSYRRSNIELIWKVPMGSWSMQNMPAGKYEIVMVPHPRNNIFNMAIESISRNKSQISTDPILGFRINVRDLYLYVYQNEDNPHAASPQVNMQFTTTKARTEDVTAAGGLQQKSFAVEGPLDAITIAFQDQQVNSDTRRSASKFKCRPEPPLEDIGLTLNRLYISYNHVKKPQPDADPSFVTPDDYLTQRYFETYQNADQPEPESKTDWIEKGPYYHFGWYDETDSGRESDYKAHVYYSFTSNLQDKANILFFYHVNHNVTLMLENGVVSKVVL